MFGNTYREGGGAQRYRSEVTYANYGDPSHPAYAVNARIIYPDHSRPDPFSDLRSGFELRTTMRADRVEVWTAGSGDAPATDVQLAYADETPTGPVAVGQAGPARWGRQRGGQEWALTCGKRDRFVGMPVLPRRDQINADQPTINERRHEDVSASCNGLKLQDPDTPVQPPSDGVRRR